MRLCALVLPGRAKSFNNPEKIMNKRTVFELRQILDLLPKDLEISFNPISGAWLGASDPLTFMDITYFNDAGDAVLATDPDAYAVIYISEDKDAKRSTYGTKDEPEGEPE